MKHVTARTRGGLRTEVTAGDHRLALDEPREQGGTDEGPTPVLALLGSLGACTAITLEMYAGRKGWPLEDVAVRVTLEEPEGPGGERRIVQEVRLAGVLDEAQRERLLQVAGRCPVHRIIEGPTRFEERLVEALPEA